MPASGVKGVIRGGDRKGAPEGGGVGRVVGGPGGKSRDKLQGCRVRNFRGRVSHFNQSEARKQCFLASDWLKYKTLPRKFRTLLANENHLDIVKLQYCIVEET